MRTPLTLALLSVFATGCAVQGIGGYGDSCNDCEFAVLESQPITVASCQREALIVTCTWSEETPLVAAPLTDLQYGMSLYLIGDERVPSVSNEGGVVTYDLSNSSWEAGDDFIFKSSLSAATDGELEPIGDTRQGVTAAELAGGIDIVSDYEVWDVGLVAERELVSDLSFEGATSLEVQTYEIETIAQVLRFVVDPQEGMAIRNAEGELASKVDQPGYYVFVDQDLAVYEAEPDTVD